MQTQPIIDLLLRTDAEKFSEVVSYLDTMLDGDASVIASEIVAVGVATAAELLNVLLAEIDEDWCAAEVEELFNEICEGHPDVPQAAWLM